MRHALILAARHLVHHRGRTLLLVLALALVAFLPLAVRRLVDVGSRGLRARAASTPLLVGARGSELDLVIASLYFAGPTPRRLPGGSAERLGSRDALVIPLHLGQSARSHPIVGTSLDYFELRDMPFAEGRPFALLGECVLGAKVAAAVADDTGPLVTDATDPFDLAGTIPLVLRPCGVLAPTGTADDGTIFVDVKTAWTIAGIGHGHERAEAIGDPNDLIGAVEREDGRHVVASERLRHAEEITPENVGLFHFHGDPSTFPLHALIVVPRDAKSAALIQGEFQRSDEPLQAVRPREAMERLLREILRVERLLSAILLAVAAVTAGVVAAVFALSVRMRQQELTTMVRLGAARGTVAKLIVAELILIVLAAGSLAALGLVATTALDASIERLFIGGER